MESAAGMSSRSFSVWGKLIDVHQRRIYPAIVVVHDGRIAEVREETAPAGDSYMAPGFVDAHIHIESSLLHSDRVLPAGGCSRNRHLGRRLVGIPLETRATRARR